MDDGQNPPEEPLWFDSCVGISTVCSGEEDARWTISSEQPRKFLTMERIEHAIRFLDIPA